MGEHSLSWKPLRFASWFPTLISYSPNLSRVYIKLCKHENHFYISSIVLIITEVKKLVVSPYNINIPYSNAESKQTHHSEGVISMSSKFPSMLTHNFSLRNKFLAVHLQWNLKYLRIVRVPKSQNWCNKLSLQSNEGCEELL